MNGWLMGFFDDWRQSWRAKRAKAVEEGGFKHAPTYLVERDAPLPVRPSPRPPDPFRHTVGVLMRRDSYGRLIQERFMLADGYGIDDATWEKGDDRAAELWRDRIAVGVLEARATLYARRDTIARAKQKADRAKKSPEAAKEDALWDALV